MFFFICVQRHTWKYFTTCESAAIDSSWSNPGSIDGITIIDKLVIAIKITSTTGRAYLDSKPGA